MDQKEKKLIAAKASMAYIQDGDVVGVGTGSTVNELIDLLPSIRDKIQAVVSSSAATTARLEALDFEVSMLNSVGDVDVYIDGADEANKHMQLIKGGGGALTREKILAGASRKFVCIIDDTKMVGSLGAFPLPVEVIPMARSYIARQFVKMRGRPAYREGFVTDNGNEILDIHDLNITNPPELEERVSRMAGVVTVGIFAHRGADVIIMAGDQGITKLEK